MDLGLDLKGRWPVGYRSSVMVLRNLVIRAVCHRFSDALPSHLPNSGKTPFRPASKSVGQKSELANSTEVGTVCGTLVGGKKHVGTSTLVLVPFLAAAHPPSERAARYWGSTGQGGTRTCGKASSRGCFPHRDRPARCRSRSRSSPFLQSSRPTKRKPRCHTSRANAPPTSSERTPIRGLVKLAGFPRSKISMGTI